MCFQRARGRSGRPADRPDFSDRDWKECRRYINFTVIHFIFFWGLSCQIEWLINREKLKLQKVN